MTPRHYYLIWFFIGVIYCINLTIDVMEVDAAQYAAMSAEMHETGNYLHVYHRGNDYLDKPPLLFWLAATSFSVFGVNNVAYKLPALLALLLALWSTYRFCRLYHEKETALLAVTILGTTLAFFQMTNDVRTDGLLTGFVMFSVWQCAGYLQKRKLTHLFFAGVGVGLAMLAKGPIGAIIPAIALICDRLMKGKWKDLLKWHWGIVIAIAAIVLLPMCYGLYTQFDLHPEKTVYGLQGPSGLRFFFWTQSFGRVTGEIYWDNNAPFYFFLLTFLWDFMPWVLIFFPALIFTIKQCLREKKSYPEYLTLGGLVLTWILLSFSQYKLPHYIFPLFPFAAILTTRYIMSFSEKRARVFSILQFCLMHLFILAMLFVFFRAFHPDRAWLIVALSVGFISLWVVLLKNNQWLPRLILVTCIGTLSFNLFMSAHFYPNLLKFQSGSVAGKMIYEDKQLNERSYYSFPQDSYSTDFYAGHYLTGASLEDLSSLENGSWIYTNEEGYEQIQAAYPDQFIEVRTFDHYHISMLKMKFLLKEQRESQLTKRYLLEKE
jgi:4-amino-4-deoxy-L-arabinose transferase-like glycosyltransferase